MVTNLIPSNPEIQDPFSWNRLFVDYAQVTKESKIPNYGTKKELTTPDERQRIALITETDTERQRIEIVPLVLSDTGERVGGKAIVITTYGDYETGEKLPAGHTFLDLAIRWDNKDLQKTIFDFAEETKTLTPMSETQEITQKGQTIRHRTYLQKRTNATLELKEILQGPGHGRIWGVLIPPEPRTTYIDFGEGNIVSLSARIGYGMTIEQGDTSDKQRTPKGTGHYQLKSLELIDC